MTVSHPLTVDDVLCAFRHYHGPSQVQPPSVSFLQTPNPICTTFLSAYDPVLSVQSMLVTQRNDSKLQHSLCYRCYQHSLTTFHHSLQQLNDPTQLAHYYTSIDDDSSIWTCLNSHIGYYSMTNAILRLYLSQPLIPLVVIICTCSGHPNNDTVGRHLFTSIVLVKTYIHSTTTVAF